MQNVPVDLLAELLRHVGQKDRLISCAVVDKKWQKAVAMATNNIVCTTASPPAVENLSAWLGINRNANNIHQFSLEPNASIYGRWEMPTVQLPIWKLTQLKDFCVTNCKLVVNPTDSPELVTALTTAATATSPADITVTLEAVRSGPLAALTALTRLLLKDTRLDLRMIGRLTALQHLDLCCVAHMAGRCFSTQAAAAEDQQGTSSYQVHDNSNVWLPQLSQLTCLTYLAVEYPYLYTPVELASAVTACFESLGRLQRLELQIPGIGPVVVAHLPTSLTALWLSNMPVLSPSTLPRMQQLMHLQSLHIVYAPQIAPAVLFSLVQLTSVCIISSRFESATAEQLPESELMLALQAMTHLKHLDLSSSLKEELQDPEIYAALTASSELSSLKLLDCRLSPGASKFMFPATSPKKALQAVTIGACHLSSEGVLESLVRCCPGVRRLEFVPEDWVLYKF